MTVQGLRFKNLSFDSPGSQPLLPAWEHDRMAQMLSAANSSSKHKAPRQEPFLTVHSRATERYSSFPVLGQENSL